MKKIFVAVSICLLGLPSAWGRTVLESNLTITSNKTGAEAKQDAFDKAIEEASFQALQEIIGPEKALKVWEGVKAKVLKNSTRYVLFIKGGVPKALPQGTEIPVSLRLSQANLEAVLRESGALSASTEGSVRVLPLVTFSDASGVNYNWWIDGGEGSAPTTTAQDVFKQFQAQLASQLKGKSIFVFDPSQASFRLSVPGSLRSEILRREDQSALAQYFKADVVLSGSVRVSRVRPDSPQPRIEFDLQMWQARTGRNLSDVQKTVDLVAVDSGKVLLQLLEEPGRLVVDEMGRRIVEAVTSGALNLSVVRLAVNGTLNYQQMEDFKKTLLDQTRELRGLKDRLFEPARVTFEVDSQVPATDLAKVLAKYRHPNFQVEVREAGLENVALWVKAR